MPFLRAAGHEIHGLDLDLYQGCDLGPPTVDEGSRVPADMRDTTPGQLAGYDAVLCLAALSNDPLGDLNPAATYSVNLDGTLHLARMAKQAGVPRFLFSSSCSLYGAAGSAAVAEDADLFPVTPYGESKVAAERELSKLADDNFSPAYLRNATAYGASTRLRLDIVVNNLTAVALTTGQVRLESDGTPWRPLVHIEDMSRAFLAVLEAPRELFTTRRSTSGGPRTTCRCAISRIWSARPSQAQALRSPTTRDLTCATIVSISPSCRDFPRAGPALAGARRGQRACRQLRQPRADV